MTSRPNSTDDMQDQTNPTSPNAGEREFEIGKDEAWFANIKRTYDEYQHESLADIRQNRNHGENVNNIAMQALQNAVETANMVGKQAVRHNDIAIDRQWNIDEQANVAAVVAKVLTSLGYNGQAD